MKTHRHTLFALSALVCLSLVLVTSPAAAAEKGAPAAPKKTDKPAAAAEKGPAKPAPKTGAKPAEKSAGGGEGGKPAPGREGGKPGKPKAPVYIPRDVPAPPVPTLDEVPPGLVPEEWQSWAQGQKVTPLHRFMVSASFWFGGERGAEAGNGFDAPEYGECLTNGPAFGPMAEVGFSPLPVIVISASFSLFPFSGAEFDKELGGIWYQYEFEGLNIMLPALHLKLRVPLALWTLESSHFAFSRASELTGVLLFFQLGAGPALWDSMGADVHDKSTGMSHWQEYWDSTVNFALIPTIGLDFRWSWGAILIGYTWLDFGTPGSAWPPNSDAEPFQCHLIRLSFGVYF